MKAEAASPRARGCLALRGPAALTARQATDLLGVLPDDAVLWAGAEKTRFVDCPPARLREKLGGGFQVVVLDLHDTLSADRIGQAQGFVWAGGTLILRLSHELERRPEALAVYPYAAADVGTGFYRRLETRLEAFGAFEASPPLRPTPLSSRGTTEQAELVDRLAARFSGPQPSLLALTADRGRGKSSALGLALGRVLADRDVRAVVSAADRSAATEVFAFAAAPEERLTFVPPEDLAHADGVSGVDIIVVDEAARLSVPLLQRIVTEHPRARIAFATTTRGYEGTGRGFVLRFLAWAREQGRPFERCRLDAPIRWDLGDPLERLVFDVLALDAEPSVVDEGSGARRGDIPWVEAVEPRARFVDKTTLAADEALLRETFGLLVHAHYRTTPSDLQRLLDAPNLDTHVISYGERILAATLVAREGGLPEALCDAMLRGERRIRGHALADTLVCHAAKRAAGELSMVRSVRIAAHPELRRRGFARTLVEHVHRHYQPDLFGTLFGATPELLAFRRAVGYELVRLGASRGARTGEPSAVMVRPSSDAARRLVATLRSELARDLPLQLELFSAAGELGLRPELVAAALRGLPDPAPLTEQSLREIVEGYAFGPRPFEAVAYPVRSWLLRHETDLSSLTSAERVAVRARILEKRSWRAAAEAAGYPTVPAAMRAVRRAFRTLCFPNGGPDDEG